MRWIEHRSLERGKEVKRTPSPINRAGSKRRASSLGGAISIKRKEIPALKYISNEPYTD